MVEKQTNVVNIIGPETRVSGEIRGETDLLVRGRVDGRIALTGDLSVEVGAIVQAEVEASNVTILGTLVGNILASASVRLGDKARVVGDITAPAVVLEAGAAYRGRIEMGDVEAAGSAAASTARRTPVAQTESGAQRTAPRLQSPAKVASVQMSGPSSPARVISAPARPSAPPIARLAQVASAPVGAPAAPAWAAKKKLKRR